MRTTIRFENAVTKLYKAFHEGRLKYGSCTKCAVGSIVGNDLWSNVFCAINLGLNPEIKDQIKYQKYIGETKNSIDRTGYSVEELAMVEYQFLLGLGNGEETKETQFEGLCAVIEYLCGLDGIPNIMDYTALFETENDKPVKELAF